MEAVRSTGDLTGLMSEQELFCGWKLRVKLSPEVGGGQAGRKLSPQPSGLAGVMAAHPLYVIVRVKRKRTGLVSLEPQLKETKQLILRDEIQKQRLDNPGCS